MPKYPGIEGPFRISPEYRKAMSVRQRWRGKYCIQATYDIKAKKVDRLVTAMKFAKRGVVKAARQSNMKILRPPEHLHAVKVFEGRREMERCIWRTGGSAWIDLASGMIYLKDCDDLIGLWTEMGKWYFCPKKYTTRHLDIAEQFADSCKEHFRG